MVISFCCYELVVLRNWWEWYKYLVIVLASPSEGRRWDWVAVVGFLVVSMHTFTWYKHAKEVLKKFPNLGGWSLTDLSWWSNSCAWWIRKRGWSDIGKLDRHSSSVAWVGSFVAMSIVLHYILAKDFHSVAF